MFCAGMNCLMFNQLFVCVMQFLLVLNFNPTFHYHYYYYYFLAAGLLGMFGRRLVSQTLQFQQLLQTVFGISDPIQPAGQRADLVRDDFGLHKMIVVATKAGKVIILISNTF